MMSLVIILILTLSLNGINSFTQKNMPKKILRRDTEIFNYGHTKGVFPNYDIPMPKNMNVKVYRKKTMVKEYDRGGDIEVVIKKPNPKPDIMRLIEKEIMQKRILKNPRKYSKLV